MNLKWIATFGFLLYFCECFFVEPHEATTKRQSDREAPRTCVLGCLYPTRRDKYVGKLVMTTNSRQNRESVGRFIWGWIGHTCPREDHFQLCSIPTTGTLRAKWPITGQRTEINGGNEKLTITKDFLLKQKTFAIC